MRQSVVLVEVLGTELEEIYRRFAPAIHRRCLAILADEDEALDALHDIFLQLYEKLSSFRGDSELMTWLYRLSTNFCLNRLRAQRVRLRVHAAAPIADGRSLTTELERRDLLRALLARFDDAHVQLAVHYWYDEMTQPELARVLGVSERTVRSRLRELEARAREEMIELERIRAGGER